MLGVGRLGSIVGSYVGGALLGLGWSFETIFALLAIPAFCAAIAITATQVRGGGEVVTGGHGALTRRGISDAT